MRNWSKVGYSSRSVCIILVRPLDQNDTKGRFTAKAVYDFAAKGGKLLFITESLTL